MDTIVPSVQEGKPAGSPREEWPDTILARTVYDHFLTFEGLNPEEAADSAGALLYALKMIGVTGDADADSVGKSPLEEAVERVTALLARKAFKDADEAFGIDNERVTFAQLRTLLAALSELQAAKWDVKHVDTMNDAVSRGMVIDDQAAEIARLKAALSSQAEMARLLSQVAGDGSLDFMIGGNPNAIEDFNASVTDTLAQYRSLNGDA